MDSLVSALGDSLTPSIIRVSFQRAGLYNDFYRQRCLEQLPNRAEQAIARGETEGESMTTSQPIHLMTDEEFVEHLKKRELREGLRNKRESRQKADALEMRGEESSEEEGQGKKISALGKIESEEGITIARRDDGCGSDGREGLDGGGTSSNWEAENPSTTPSSSLHPSLNTTHLGSDNPSSTPSSSLHPSLTSPIPKRYASVEASDYIAEKRQLRILHDDDESDDSGFYLTSSRGCLIKPQIPWSPTLFRRLPPTTLW